MKPRNDFVLVRIVSIGETESGIQLPDYSIEGKEFVVDAIGPDVENLNVGDKILAIGTIGQDLVYLPRRKDLFLTKQNNIVVVF